jgi:hypothetical protein
MRLFVISLVVALIGTSVVAADPKKSASVTEARSTGAFTGLAIRSVMDVELAIGKTTTVELRGPAEWLARVTTTVKDDVLVVDMPGKWRKIPELKMVITTPSLSSLSISGVGNVVATGLDGKAFAVDVSGTGQIELSGAVDKARIDLSGAVELDAKNLVTKISTVDISGTGEVSVHATKQLDVSISGVGNVTVHGKPAKVNKSITGMGNIELE